MKSALCIFIIFISYNLSICQQNTFPRFKISLVKGITYNFDNDIRNYDYPISSSVSSFNVDLTEMEIGYFIAESHEIGVTVGKNSFTEPENFVVYYSVEPNNDTIFMYAPRYKYVEMTWISLYYNFHFLNEYKAGLKLGRVYPTSASYEYFGYFSLMAGKSYKVTDNFFVDVNLNYSNRNRINKLTFKSHQLSLTMAFNLRI